MTPNAPMAPQHRRAEWRIAMIAAMKKVLSLISLIRIIVPLFTMPSRNSPASVIAACLRALGVLGRDTLEEDARRARSTVESVAAEDGDESSVRKL